MLEGMMVILLGGIVFGKIFQHLKLPSVIGYILCGIIIGPYALDLISEVIVGGEEFSGISKGLSDLALILILLRAGLETEKSVLRKIKSTAVKLSIIPCLVEGVFITIAAIAILGFSLAEGGMLGFIIAAVSPAIIVPAMLAVKEKHYGEDKEIPTLVVGSASIDDVITITIFTAFLNIGLQGTELGIASLVGSIGFQIAGGVIAGYIAGKIIIVALGSREFKQLETLGLVLVAAIALFMLEEAIHIAGLLGVMTLGFMITDKHPKASKVLDEELTSVWFFAEVFLFVLVGSKVNLALFLDVRLVLLGILIIGIGLIGRSIGVFISTYKTDLNIKEKFFCVIANIPKATVQAAIGSVPLAMGIPYGEVILLIAVLSILITVPLGSIGIEKSIPKLLKSNEEKINI